MEFTNAILELSIGKKAKLYRMSALQSRSPGRLGWPVLGTKLDGLYLADGFATQIGTNEGLDSRQ
jgi:hypothetical protein